MLFCIRKFMLQLNSKHFFVPFGLCDEDEINQLRETGVCILFASHSTEVIQRNCGSAILLDGGKLITHDTAEASVAAYHDLLYGSQNPRLEL